MLRLVLRNAGYDVVTRESPFGASAAIMSEKPDLVLIDVSMPALRGDKLIDMLRNRAAAKGTRLFLYSGQPIDVLEKLVESCGADGYIQKTIDSHEFLRRIENIFGNGHT